jgi:ubiquitin C-terminal hydrolase
VAHKRFLIQRAPPVLVLHLKRFHQNETGQVAKLDQFLSYPEVLDLTPFCSASVLTPPDAAAAAAATTSMTPKGPVAGSTSKLAGRVSGDPSMSLCDAQTQRLVPNQPVLYQLTGLVVHVGGFQGGHYAAYVCVNSVWCYATDMKVRVCDLDEVLSRQAYLLFYTRIEDASP